MKKKTYTSPMIEEIDCSTEEMLAVSVLTGDNVDILFGGDDVKGVLDPAAPSMDNLEEIILGE